jgi:hypothetical protein
MGLHVKAFLGAAGAGAPAYRTGDRFALSRAHQKREGAQGSWPTRLQASGQNADRWGGAAASFWWASDVRGQLNVGEKGGVLTELGVM